MTPDPPIPEFDPDPQRTVYDNAHMAIRALDARSDGPVDAPDAEEVVLRRVPGGGPPQARAVLKWEAIDVRAAPAEGFM